MSQNAEAIHEVVQQRYGAIARSSSSEKAASCCGDGACCGPSEAGEGCGNLYDSEMLEGLPLNVTGLSLGWGESQYN